MSQHEREFQRPILRGGPDDEDGGGNLATLRDEAARMSSAAGDAIERALSGNSLAFLESMQQRGGQ